MKDQEKIKSIIDIITDPDWHIHRVNLQREPIEVTMADDINRRFESGAEMDMEVEVRKTVNINLRKKPDPTVPETERVLRRAAKLKMALQGIDINHTVIEELKRFGKTVADLAARFPSSDPTKGNWERLKSKMEQKERGAGDDYPVEAITRSLTVDDLKTWLNDRADKYFSSGRLMNYDPTSKQISLISDFIGYAIQKAPKK